MGYGIYITRAAEWAQNQGCEIARDEWNAVVEADPTLNPQPSSDVVAWNDASFEFDAGNVRVANPTREAIEKAVEISTALSARVMGDDGELYEAGGVVRHATEKLTIRDRLLNARDALTWQLWGRRKIQCPFRVGSRVHDGSGREGTVLAVDPKAEHGAGLVTVRFDDGAELTSLLLAPGIELIKDETREP